MSRHRRRCCPAPATEEPENVNGLWTARTEFYRRQLKIMIKGLFKSKIENDWDRDYILDLLLTEGVFVVTNTDAGTLALRTAFEGVNYMNHPTRCVISVPTLPDMVRTIGEDCEIVYLQRNDIGTSFYTVNAIVNIFAERLASADACIDVNLMNSRVAYLIEAETKAQAETIKWLYSKITNGEPMVVVRKGSTGSLTAEGANVFFNNVKSNFIADLVQDEKRSIINEFLTYWGVNNANTDKKERLITGEVDSNNMELECNISHFRQNLERQMRKVHKMFPDLKFELEFQFNALNEMGGAINAIVGNGKSMGVSPQPAVLPTRRTN